jgi:excisionase family DNA binding protein
MYKLKEVAAMLRISYVFLFNKVKQGKVKAIKIGGAWRIMQDEVDRILKEGIQ